MDENRKIEQIDINKIIPNIYQPRIRFDDKSLTELSKSIKEYGIIQPLILRKIGNSYEIIDGERRYKASKKNNLQQVPAIVLNIDDKKVAEIILTDNLQKKLLTPIEEANAYQQIMLVNKMNIEELAEKIGKDENTIESKLKLLRLASEIQEALLDNKISEGHARVLTKIDDKVKQLDLYNKVIKERLNVKALEELVNDKTNSIKKENKENEEKEKNKDDIVSLEKLSIKEILTEKKENKTEETNMDNTQLNFNQYNNLLKEQEKPMMQAMMQPEPIIGNNVLDSKPNEFFPSLEEQPLNLEVPVENSFASPNPMELPQNEMPTPAMSEPVMQQPVMEAPQIGAPMEFPQFEMPAPAMPEPVMQQPVMEAPQMGAPMEFPQFEMPAPAMSEPVMQQPVMEAPQMGAPMEFPQFEMPAPAMSEPVMQQPVMEAPQMGAPMEFPQFEMPAPTMPEPVMQQPVMEAPQMGAPMELPQFEMPTPVMPEPVMQQPVMIDVMPAVNMIRNLIPLLENSGYKINIEESDNPTEYQITLKVEK